MSNAAPAIAVTATEGTPAPAETTPAPADTTPAPAETTPAPADTTPASEPAKLWSDPVKTEEAPADAPKDPSAPEWFMKDKYKTVDDQAKAHYDLQKLMGKNWGAPKDDYVVEGIEGIVSNDPLLEHLKPKLKELGLSQDGFANLVKGYQEANLAMAKKIEAEVTETLTKTEAMTVQSVDRWLNEAFSEADRKTIQSWIMSVDDFKVLNAIRTLIPAGSNVPSALQGAAVKYETTKEVDNEKVKYRQEVANGLRVADKNFENELQQRWRDAYTRGERSKK